MQDYWRNVAFMIKEPGLALANDTVFNLTQAAAFAAIFVAHVHSITAVITAWGMAGFAGAIYGLYQFRVIPTLRGGLSLIRSRWGMSKWLAATSFTNWGSNQAESVHRRGYPGPGRARRPQGGPVPCGRARGCADTGRWKHRVSGGEPRLRRKRLEGPRQGLPCRDGGGRPELCGSGGRDIFLGRALSR